MTKKIFLGIAAGIILCGTGWLACLVYTKITLLEGKFFIINNTEKDANIVIRFPSGRTHNFLVRSNWKMDFTEKNTGEGSIQINLNGTHLKPIGYVTSYNSLTILSLSEGKSNDIKISLL